MIGKLFAALVVMLTILVCAFALALVVGLALTAVALIHGVLPSDPRRRIGWR